MVRDDVKGTVVFMPMFYYDSYYLMLVIPALLISGIAQFFVKSTFSKYSKVLSQRGMQAHEIARKMLDDNGLYHVQVERVSGHLTDHFDPTSNIVRLSDSVYSSQTVASIGVAAHEVGHAIQYANNYIPIKIRAVLIPVTNLGSSIALPLAMLGIFFSLEFLVTAGILLFSAVVLFQLVTLPVEFDASIRAINTLDTDGYLSRDELKGSKRVLSAAAMTYVAALIVSLANLLRLVLLSRRER